MHFLSTFGSWCGGPGFMQGGSSWSVMMPYHIGSIFQLLVIGAIIYFVARLVRRPDTGTGLPTHTDILKRRYAAGEIDKTEFDRLRDELK